MKAKKNKRREVFGGEIVETFVGGRGTVAEAVCWKSPRWWKVGLHLPSPRPSPIARVEGEPTSILGQVWRRRWQNRTTLSLWEENRILNSGPGRCVVGADEDIGAGAFNVAVGETDVYGSVGMVEEFFVDDGSVGPGEAVGCDGGGSGVGYGVVGEAVVIGVVVAVGDEEGAVQYGLKPFLSHKAGFLPLLHYEWAKENIGFLNVTGEKDQGGGAVISGLLIQIWKGVCMNGFVHHQSDIHLPEMALATDVFHPVTFTKHGRKEGN